MWHIIASIRRRFAPGCVGMVGGARAGAAQCPEGLAAEQSLLKGALSRGAERGERARKGAPF